MNVSLGVWLTFCGADHVCPPSSECERPDHWVVRSADGGGPFDLHQAPYARGYFVGDYQGLDSQGNAFRALFTLASPSVGTFPNPNPTDEFISDPF